jgi:hypothetical protein
LDAGFGYSLIFSVILGVAAFFSLSIPLSFFPLGGSGYFFSSTLAAGLASFF